MAYVLVDPVECNYIVHINNDVCFHRDIKKATLFSSLEMAQSYIERWALEDYEPQELPSAIHIE